jgi:hypothetical protein
MTPVHDSFRFGGAGDRSGPDSIRPSETPARSDPAPGSAGTFWISATQEEVSLLFGSPFTEADFIVVKLDRRVILSPAAAKRFSSVLDRFLEEYESKFGDIREDEPDRRETKPLPGVPNREEIADKAGVLFRLKASLGLEGRYEESFKVAGGELLSNRFLLGASKAAIGRHADEKLLESCSLLGMPADLATLFREHLPYTSCVHFGFEGDPLRAIYKVYVEFDIPERPPQSSETTSPRILYLGFKWNASDPGQNVVTRYTWYPWLAPEAITARIRAMTGNDPGLMSAAEGMLSLAVSKMPARHILYLEATEEGNPRRSFDLNVYPAQLSVAEAYPLLSALCRQQSVAYDAFHAVYDRIRDRTLGHLAGGLDRNGKPFFTVYYGAQPAGAVAVEDGTRRIRTSPVRSGRSIRTETTDPEGARLFSIVTRVAPAAMLERSFKFAPSVLFTNRFLLSVARQESGSDLDKAMLAACADIGMPEEYLTLYRSRYPDAKNVLFGFERGASSAMYKTYLEYTQRMRPALKMDPLPDSILTYDGFKWDRRDLSRKAHTEYRAITVFSARDIAVRFARSLSGLLDPGLLRILDDFVDLAGSRTAAGDLIYCEASERGNARTSFDFNFYRARLAVAETYPLLLRLVRHFRIDPGDFEGPYQAIRTHSLGHLSGGIDREGGAFVSLYFS